MNSSFVLISLIAVLAIAGPAALKAPNADCAVYTAAKNIPLSTIFRTASVIQLAAGASVSRVYVGNTCSLALYTTRLPDPMTDFPEETKVGSAGNFQSVTTTNAVAYTCKCT